MWVKLMLNIDSFPGSPQGIKQTRCTIHFDNHLHNGVNELDTQNNILTTVDETNELKIEEHFNDGRREERVEDRRTL